MSFGAFIQAIKDGDFTTAKALLSTTEVKARAADENNLALRLVSTKDELPYQVMMYTLLRIDEVFKEAKRAYLASTTEKKPDFPEAPTLALYYQQRAKADAANGYDAENDIFDVESDSESDFHDSSGENSCNSPNAARRSRVGFP